MKLAILLMLSGCVKNGLINKARNHFANEENCLEILQKQVKKAGCEEIQVEYRKNSTLIRCDKPDKDRGRFWDNYIFRISPVSLKIDQRFLPEIEKNTICMDNQVRIEAYPPSEK